MRPDSSQYSIVTKVGAVILRVRKGMLEILVVQPKPKAKTPYDLPPIGLPRGTRMYRAADGSYVDADHDGRTAPPPGAELEPVYETLVREIEEEAGVTRAMLAAAQVTDLGPLVFPSLKKIPYPIHWFLVMLGEDVVLPHIGLADSLHTQWGTLEALADLVEAKKMSRGYIGVIDAALAKFQELQTKP